MSDYLAFKKMITPLIVQVIFWIGVVLVVLAGVFFLMNEQALQGLLMIVFGPIGWRVYCEMLIVMFSINDTLTDIRNDARRRGAGVVSPPGQMLATGDADRY
ncbi:MAG: DUF4282 domain-containing protein [Planctomycetales bacterium]